MLDRLPFEILRLIGERLDEVFPEGVIDLACANKRCFCAIATFLYRTLRFPISDSDQLAKDVHNYSRLLQRTDGYRCVRRIVIESRFAGEIFERTPEHDPKKRWRRPQLSDIEKRGGDREVMEESILRNCYGDLDTRAPLEQLYLTDHLWKPLATFIRQLSALESIFHEGYSQFPPCLLQAIHQFQPECKLYLTNFHLISLNLQGRADGHESAILRSPCLRGIGIELRRAGEYDSPGTVNFSLQTLKSYISCTPNLKILILTVLPPARLWQVESRQHWARPVQQFGHGHGHDRPESLVSLDHLRISDWSECLETMRYLNDTIDFSVLKVLGFHDEMEQDLLEYLATECEFPSLIELHLDLLSRSASRSPIYTSTVCSILTKIPALRILKLSGWSSGLCTGTIFKHHGSSLHQLDILPAVGERISLQDLEIIAQNCTDLEKLAVTISRSKGDAQECAKYKVLGSFPRLQHLILRLDPSNYHMSQEGEEGEEVEVDYEVGDERRVVMPSDPTFNDFDQQPCSQLCYQIDGFIQVPRKGHVRDAFINGALDSDLAVKIWKTITSEKHSLERICNLNMTTLSLMSMDVKVFKGGPFYRRPKVSSVGIAQLRRLLYHICDEYHVEQMVGQGGNIEIKAELKKVSLRYKDPLVPWMEELFRRVWPSKSDKWQDDWHSFPLAASAGEEIDWKSR